MASAEAPKGELTALDVPESVRELFWSLAEATADGRVGASTGLCEAYLKDEGGEDIGPLGRYILRRLAKGVGSGRAMARQGFAVALAALLERMPDAQRQAALELVDAR